MFQMAEHTHLSIECGDEKCLIQLPLQLKVPGETHLFYPENELPLTFYIVSGNIRQRYWKA
jgi:hypothetical protein